MRSKDNRSVLNDPALAYGAQPAADEVDGMPGWKRGGQKFSVGLMVGRLGIGIWTSS